MATQLVTAICKLVYKWFNDGDVYDNNYHLDGWANDLSSYANWMYKYVPGTQSILERIYEIYSESQYEQLLFDLARKFLDLEDLEHLDTKPSQGSIYNCSGPFSFSEDEDDDEDDYYDEESEDDDW